MNWNAMAEASDERSCTLQWTLISFVFASLEGDGKIPYRGTRASGLMIKSDFIFLKCWCGWRLETINAANWLSVPFEEINSKFSSWMNHCKVIGREEELYHDYQRNRWIRIKDILIFHDRELFILKERSYDDFSNFPTGTALPRNR